MVLQAERLVTWNALVPAATISGSSWVVFRNSRDKRADIQTSPEFLIRGCPSSVNAL
jgi:hypothetical protein